MIEIIENLIPKLESPSLQQLLSRFKVFPQSDIVELGSKYNILHPKVLVELNKDKRLKDFLLNEAYANVKRYFPDAKELILDYSIDPEWGTKGVVLYVTLEKDPDEAYQALRKFDEEWWLDRNLEFKNLCIHLQLI